MPIKFYNPTSAGRRAGSVLDYKAVLTAFEPQKSLTKGKRRASGRNHHGVITAKHRGGGNKRLYRVIDFKRQKDGMPATVKTIEYDPNRSVHIALVEYTDGVKSYILAPNGIKVGQTIVSGPDAPPEIGNTLPLANIPSGLEIHNIEMNPGQGGKLVRSAGGVGRLGAKEGEWSVIILPSNEMRRLVTFTFAILFPVLAHAAQVIPTGVEYTNDTIEQGGKLAACIVTTAIISPPAPEIVPLRPDRRRY